MEKLFKTKCLYEGSYLMNEGMTLKKLEKEGQAYWFVFEETKNCEELIGLFRNGRALTNAREYANEIRNLKDMIFAQK